MPQRTYYVYILTNRSRTLYVGMTNDIARRVEQHQQKLVRGFTSRYNLTMLVHYEMFTSVWEAIAREKELKGWRRSKKLALIESENPDWRDLSLDISG